MGLVAVAYITNAQNLLTALVGLFVTYKGLKLIGASGNGAHQHVISGAIEVLIGLLIVGLGHGANAANLMNWLEANL